MRTSFATISVVLHQSDLLPDHRQHRRVRNQSDVHALHGQVGILDGAGAFNLMKIVLRNFSNFLWKDRGFAIWTKVQWLRDVAPIYVQT